MVIYMAKVPFVHAGGSNLREKEDNNSFFRK